MLDLVVKWAKALGALGGVCTGLWYWGDTNGFRPVLKYELERQGYFNRRLTLLDKKAAGTITPLEFGELCGLSYVLHMPVTGCPEN